MSTLLKILLGGLLLVLLLAVGTEVVALHDDESDVHPPATPVIVRKAAHDPTTLKMVRHVPSRLPLHSAPHRKS